MFLKGKCQPKNLTSNYLDIQATLCTWGFVYQLKSTTRSKKFPLDKGT